MNTSGWLLLVAATGTLLVEADNSSCESDDDEQQEEWVSDGGFFLLLLGVSAMFWALAAVVEEYFVPALNILCEELNVPDDVAGATFMAAGASSPEMFTSFIALFVDHSTLGVGTVVGSEIFNHMIICAGSVMYSTEGVLYLDKYIFSRDVCAYFISLIVLLWSIKGNIVSAFENMFASGVENECLNVTVWHATGLLVLYSLYAIVSGNFQSFLKKFDLVHVNPPESDQNLRESLLNMSAIEEVDEEKDDEILNVLTSAVQDSSTPQNSKLIQRQSNHPMMSYSYRSRRLTGGGPSMRVKSKSYNRNNSQQMSNFVKDQAMYSWRSSNYRNQSYLLQARNADPDTVMRQSKADVIGPSSNGFHACLRAMGSEADKEEMGTMEISSQSLSGYLFLKSKFFNMKCCSPLRTWRLRYFTIDKNGFHSRKNRESLMKGPQIEMIDLHTCHSIEVTDRSQGLFVLYRTGEESTFDSSDSEKAYEFSATSLELLDELVNRLSEQIEEAKRRSREERLQFNRRASAALEGEFHLDDDGENHTSLLDPPDVEYGSPRGMLATIWHYTLYPLKFALHHTLPDVMLKGGREKYLMCLLVSVIWLALLSYVMIKCCDGLGVWIGTSPIVMGLTLSAIGTSFPNLWSSMLVARQGLGNMAVSNAFGSNTFNICIALGLPWFSLVLISGESYDKMRDDGIVFMLALLTGILVIFYFLVMFHSWQIRYWMAYYFVATYIGVMVYAILHG